MKTLIATITLLIAPFIALANEKPEAPAPKPEAVYGWHAVSPLSPAKAPFRWNKKFYFGEMAVEGAAIAADEITTVHVIYKPGQYETNSFLGRHPSEMKITAYGAAEFAIAGVIGYVAERNHHKPIRFAGRALIAGSVINHGQAATCNATRNVNASCMNLPIGLF